MIKTVKKTLPVMVFITLSTGAVGLSLQASTGSILVGGLGAALITALLLYAVINWDDAFQHKKRETLQLASVVNHAMDAIMIFDARGSVLYANPAAERAYHLAGSDPRGATMTTLGWTPEESRTIIDAVLRNRAWNGELKHTHPGGPHTHLINMFRLEAFRDSAPAVVAIGRDLTRRKELERRLRHSEKLAAVGELAAGMAHEINNPIAAIQSQIGLVKDLLRGGVPDALVTAEMLECVREADRQVRRCSGIIDSLLRFARQGEVSITELRIDEAVEQAVAFVKCLSKMDGVELSCEYDARLPRIASNQDSIAQIVVNLLLNAADACGGQGTIRISVHPSEDGRIAIEVLDRGSGIAPEIQERVFEPFFTTKEPGNGTGLGLSISYGLARALGGELRLRQPPAGGTSATLYLPLTPRGNDEAKKRGSDNGGHETALAIASGPPAATQPG